VVAATCASVAATFTVHVVDAAIVSGSGNVQHIAPPASVISGATEHATDVLAFDEQQGVTLASALRTDINSPGVYDELADLQASTIATGTVVDSHLVHSDRTATGTTLRDFTITFRTDILGVIVTQGKLTDSDVLGAAGVAQQIPQRGEQRCQRLAERVGMGLRKPACLARQQRAVGERLG